jgi:hypothetical protein
MLKLKGKLVEVSELGEYQGSPYASVKVRSPLTGGQILKYKLNLKSVDHSKLEKMLDSDVELTLEIVKGQGELASLKAVEVKTAGSV